MSEEHFTSIVSQSFSEGTNKITGGVFRKWNLKDTENNEYSKIVPDDFESHIQDKANVRIIFNQNGRFKNIVDVLQVQKTELVKKQEPVSIDTKSKSILLQSNSAGMRNGMITGRAVELAIARNETDFEGLQQAALDVKALADFVEKQS